MPDTKVFIGILYYLVMEKKKKESGLKKEDSKKAYPIKIGLEVHGYLNTNEKLFCMCKTKPNGDEKEDKPNSRVCPICTGQPGSKPMLPNSEALKKVIEVGLVLGCKINHDKKLVWQRKHYNWADLPKGYQNTISGAYSVPVCENGSFMGVGITECHLEEDPAQWNPDTGRVNYNRSGLPLIEIVTEPEFYDSIQVVEWLNALLQSLSYIKAVRKNAGIKCDVNVSTYGERVEIKNVSSIESIRQAIEYEVERQIENYNQGIEQKRDTLSFDSIKGKTIKMREKESGEDYRFIPDPDLPIIKIDEKLVKKLENELPEMPEVKLEKLIKKYKLEKNDAEILARNLELVEFVEELDKHIKGDVKKYISWVTIELLRILNYNKKTLEDVEILPKHLAELIEAVSKDEITVLAGKKIMNDFIPNSFSVREKGLIGKTSEGDIEKIVKGVIKDNGKVVDDYKNGNEKSLNFLIGEVMKKSDRRADFKVARELILKAIN